MTKEEAIDVISQCHLLMDSIELLLKQANAALAKDIPDNVVALRGKDGEG